jgi:hypothetical protein
LLKAEVFDKEQFDNETALAFRVSKSGAGGGGGSSARSGSISEELITTPIKDKLLWAKAMHEMSVYNDEAYEVDKAKARLGSGSSNREERGKEDDGKSNPRARAKKVGRAAQRVNDDDEDGQEDDDDDGKDDDVVEITPRRPSRIDPKAKAKVARAAPPGNDDDEDDEEDNDNTTTTTDDDDDDGTF